MSRYDVNRSVRIVFSVDELNHLRIIATRNNMSIAELCKAVMKEAMKYDNEKMGRYDANRAPAGIVISPISNIGDIVVIETVDESRMKGKEKNNYE
jgi:hypothetical protein